MTLPVHRRTNRLELGGLERDELLKLCALNLEKNTSTAAYFSFRHLLLKMHVLYAFCFKLVALAVVFFSGIKFSLSCRT